MSITWTKEWAASDDGTIVKGLDLKNIQDDIDAGVGDATKIQGKDIDAAVTGDDDKVIFWDNDNDKYDYKEVVDITGDQTIAGDKTFSDDIIMSSSQMLMAKGADVESGTSIVLGDDGNHFDITGTTTIQTITIKQAGTVVWLKFDGDLTLTDDTGNLELQGVDVTVAAEDVVVLVSDGTNWHKVSHSSASSGSVEVFTTTGTNNWTVPTGINYVSVSICGGGGGGGGGDNAGSGGGGGGAQAIIKHILKVTPGQQYAVTIGAGGAGTAGNSSPGSDGGTSSFVGLNYTLTALGGNGGPSKDSQPAGAAEEPETVATAGNNSGATGGVGATYYAFAGGAGGEGLGGGTNGGGGGGASRIGGGGAGGDDQGAGGEDGAGPGGGGGGTGTGSGTGGAGADGICILEYGANGTPA